MREDQAKYEVGPREDLAQQASQWATVSGAARLTSVVEGTIRHAITRGDLHAYSAGDGTRLVYLPDVYERWGHVPEDPPPSPQ